MQQDEFVLFLDRINKFQLINVSLDKIFIQMEEADRKQFCRFLILFLDKIFIHMEEADRKQFCRFEKDVLKQILILESEKTTEKLPLNLNDSVKIRQLKITFNRDYRDLNSPFNLTSPNLNSPSNPSNLYNLNDPYSSIRSIILKNIKNKEILQKYISDRNPSVRLSVLKAISKMNGNFDIKSLCHFINDSNTAVRIKFCKLLKKYKNEDFIKQMIKMFDKESDGTFIYGAEDESVKVRIELIRSLRVLTSYFIRNNSDSINSDLDVLINCLFNFLSDMLNDDSLTVRILSIKLLYKICKKFTVKKDLSEMFGIILCFKEKSFKIRKYLLKTISYVYYNDISIMDYLFKNESVEIEEIMKRIIKRNKQIFIDRIDKNGTVNGTVNTNINLNKNGTVNTNINTNKNGTLNGTVNTNINTNKNEITNKITNEITNVNLKNTRRKFNNPFLFSSNEQRKKYKIQYIADLLVFSILKISNLNDQILKDVERLKKKKSSNNSNFTELKMLLNYNENELKNVRFNTSICKFIKDSILSTNQFKSQSAPTANHFNLIPFKFRIPRKVFNKITKNNFNLSNLVKIFIENKKYTQIKDYSFKIFEKDVPSFLPYEFDVKINYKYLTKYDKRKVKFIIENNGKYIIYNLERNIKVQIETKERNLNCFIGVIINNEILKL